MSKRKRISSPSTVFRQIVVLGVLLPGMVTGSCLIALTHKSPQPVLTWMYFVVLAGVCTGMIYIIILIKEVFVEGSNLIVRSIGEEETVVPMQDVNEVIEQWYSRPHMVTIKLRPGSPMEKIVFVPPLKLFQRRFSDHPTVVELRRAIARAQAGNTGSRV
jgi:hypothetical protein